MPIKCSKNLHRAPKINTQFLLFWKLHLPAPLNSKEQTNKRCQQFLAIRSLHSSKERQTVNYKDDYWVPWNTKKWHFILKSTRHRRAWGQKRRKLATLNRMIRLPWLSCCFHLNIQGQSVLSMAAGNTQIQRLSSLWNFGNQRLPRCKKKGGHRTAGGMSLRIGNYQVQCLRLARKRPMSPWRTTWGLGIQRSLPGHRKWSADHL